MQETLIIKLKRISNSSVYTYRSKLQYVGIYFEGKDK